MIKGHDINYLLILSIWRQNDSIAKYFDRKLYYENELSRVSIRQNPHFLLLPKFAVKIKYWSLSKLNELSEMWLLLELQNLRHGTRSTCLHNVLHHNESRSRYETLIPIEFSHMPNTLILILRSHYICQNIQNFY